MSLAWKNEFGKVLFRFWEVVFWLVLVGLIALSTYLTLFTVALPMQQTATQSVWLPATAEKVKSIRNYFDYSGRAFSGGGGAIASTEFQSLSLDDFKRETKDFQKVIVSLEHGNTNATSSYWYINYLGLKDDYVTNTRSYQIQINPDGNLFGFQYQFAAPYFTDQSNQIGILYIFNWALRGLFLFVIALAIVIFWRIVWDKIRDDYLGPRFGVWMGYYYGWKPRSR